MKAIFFAIGLGFLGVSGGIAKCSYDRKVIKNKIEEICSKTGVYILENESVGLYDVVYFESESRLKSSQRRLVVDDGYYLDLDKIRDKFDIKMLERDKIDDMDTWYFIKSSISRKSDKKLLGYSKSAEGFSRDYKGLSQGAGDLWCPQGFDSDGKTMSYSVHKELVRRVLNVSREIK